jgi:hypothetical protein
MNIHSDYARDTKISYFQTLFNKGISGEYKVSKIIGATNRTDKFVIHNLIIKSDEKTSQIDHIVIQTNGILS